MVQRDSGAEFAIGYDILELVEPELIVLRSDPMPEMGMHEPTITRVELHDIGGRTRMTLTTAPTPRPDTPRPAGTPPSTSSRWSSPRSASNNPRAAEIRHERVQEPIALPRPGA